MPSAAPLPTIADLRQAYSDAIIGQRDARADTRTGSAYDFLGGPAAILFSREAQRDRDLFRACYNDTADGDDLSARLNALYGYPRVLDSYGTGTMQIARPNATGGAGTIPAGTRIIASTSATDPRVFAVAQDTPVSATMLGLSVPIRATVYGIGVALNTGATPVVMRIDDPLFDNTFVPQSLVCADGTAFEPAAAYRARVRAARFNSRVGYAAAIIQALNAIGAVNVALFASNFTGDANDHGLNVCYVADAGFSASGTFLNQCIHTLESVRVLGADLQVFPMQTQSLGVTMTVRLWQDPGNFNLVDIQTGIVAELQAYFDGRKNAYSYQVDAMAAAVARASSAVQRVDFPTSFTSVGVTTLVNGQPQWPGVLTRYLLNAGAIQISFAGPA
jgi:hypothetical protein